jgi:hypothetical protein
MSILTARGRLKLEMRSPVDRVTTVFFSCFVDNYRLSCNVSTLLALFFLQKNGGKTISAARGRTRPDVTSPIDSLTPISYRWASYFGSVSRRSKVIRLFRFACTMPSEKSGKGCFPEIISSLDEIPKSHFLVANDVV